MTSVYIRKRKGADGKLHLYLDYYPALFNPITRTTRKHESLKMYIYDDPKDDVERNYNQETLRLAEAVRCKRSIAIMKGELDFIEESFAKSDFLGIIDLAVALTLCVAAVGLAVAIAVLAISETALPPVAESSSQGVTEESDPSAEESIEESIAESSAPSAESSEAEISLPEESTEESVPEPLPEPEPGLGGEIPQLGSTREYESYIGLRYSVDLVQFEKYIDPANASEYLLLVSPKAPLGKDYVPDDLIYIEDMRAGRPSYYSYLREYAEKALEAFLDEAAMYGHGDIKVSNGYRSYSVQSTLFNNYLADERARHPDWTEEQIYNLVATYSNPPGTSEHQLGLAVDIVADGYYVLDYTQAKTATQAWLMEHCWEYGFILRYPEDKQDITKIIYESWHYRYVGVDHAKAITENELCLEEYLEILKEGGLEKDGE